MRSIGELAKEAGVKVPTIRYYEQIGLLAAPPRTDGQQRRYDDHAASRLHFIRHARHLGFEIDDIRELLALSAQPGKPCDNADKITAHSASGKCNDRERLAHSAPQRSRAMPPKPSSRPNGVTQRASIG
jgi:DNA-binding transcriptional MerR regulator